MFCRSEVSIALLGQNQSTEASSTHASAIAGLEVAKDLRDADAHLVEGAINQLLRWVVDVNMGEDAPAPVFELFEEEEVSETQAKRDEALARSGARFSPAYYQRVYGLQDGDLSTEPAPGAAAPPGAPAAAAPPGGTAPEFAEPAAPRDAIDDVVDAELSQWQTALDPLVDPVQQLIDQAAREGWPASELLQRLPAVLSDMDPTAMANALTKLALTARLAAGAAIPTAED
jgi:phage gp29-like protein